MKCEIKIDQMNNYCVSRKNSIENWFDVSFSFVPIFNFLLLNGQEETRISGTYVFFMRCYIDHVVYFVYEIIFFALQIDSDVRFKKLLVQWS